jgi:LysM repeat protein
VLRDYAERAGEDRAWLDRIFQVGHGDAGRGRGSPGKGHWMLQHARRHRDHFHVRFYAPRSQELGRRVLPLLARRPEQNLALHTIRRGQTLGHLARTYHTTVQALAKANRLQGTRARLHAGQQLLIPLRGPCTTCPLPPPLVVPPRCLPPAMELARRAAQPHQLLAAATQTAQKAVPQEPQPVARQEAPDEHRVHPSAEPAAPPASPPIETRTAAQPVFDPTLPDDAAAPAAGRP